MVEDEPATLPAHGQAAARPRATRSRRPDTIAAALEAAEAGDFDLIVSDIGLPDGSGLDLMRGSRGVHPCPAIALTGYGMEEDIRRSREAGFTAHLTKPIDFDRLLTAIGEVADQRNPDPDRKVAREAAKSRRDGPRIS